MISTHVKAFTDFKRYIIACKAQQPFIYRKHPTWMHPYKVLEAYITGNCPAKYVFEMYYLDFLSGGQQIPAFKEFCEVLDPSYEKRSSEWFRMKEKERGEEIIRYLTTAFEPFELSQISCVLKMIQHRLEYLTEKLDRILFTKKVSYPDPPTLLDEEEGCK